MLNLNQSVQGNEFPTTMIGTAGTIPSFVAGAPETIIQSLIQDVSTSVRSDAMSDKGIRTTLDRWPAQRLEIYELRTFDASESDERIGTAI